MSDPAKPWEYRTNLYKRAVRLGSRSLRAVALQVGVSTILFAGVAHAAEPCKTVTYLVGVSLNDPASNIPGYMQISVPRGEFTVANLICIVRAIRESRQSDSPLMIMFFASTAPIKELPDAIESPRVNALVRAVYVLQPDKPHERLSLTPFGYGAGVLSSGDGLRLDNDEAHCVLALDGRCVLTCEVLDEAAEGFTGSVRLSGRVTRDGTVDQIRVLNQSSNNTIPASMIARAAVSNLKSLWLEPSERESHFLATYRFGVGASTLGKSDLSIDFSPEEALRIRVAR